jgi:DNA-binding response OmpR family regulator
MPAHSSILAIRCSSEIRDLFRDYFEKDGGTVVDAATYEQAHQALSTQRFDIVCVELNCQPAEMLEGIEQLRQEHPKLPFLILTGAGHEQLAQRVLKQGINLYLMRPLDPLRVISRMQEVLLEQKQARTEQQIISEVARLLDELQDTYGPEQTELEGLPAGQLGLRYLRAGPFIIDLYARWVKLGEQTISMPSSIFDYLVTLARFAPQTVSYEELVRKSQRVYKSSGDLRNLARWRIHELRLLLEPDPDNPVYIRTVRSVGYRLAV